MADGTAPTKRAATARVRKASLADGAGALTAVIHNVSFSRGTVDDAPARPPKNVLAREIRENLAKFPHCILLTRVGNFYEVRSLPPPVPSLTRSPVVIL